MVVDAKGGGRKRSPKQESAREEGAFLPSDPISHQVMVDLFDRHRIVRDRRHRRPSSAALRELATDTESLRQLFKLNVGPWRRSRKVAADFSAALQLLVETLPPVRAEMLDFAKTPIGGGVLAKSAARNLCAIDALATAVADMQQTSWFRLKQIDAAGLAGIHANWWHDLAGAAADAFRIAMKSTNPDLVLQASNTGPVSNFVAAVIPLITKERPTILAVARHLQRTEAHR